MVTCALCGTKMTADTQVCPKCGSLNAHFSYHKHFGELEAAEEVLMSSPIAPVKLALPPNAPSPPSTSPHETKATKPAHGSTAPRQPDTRQQIDDTAALTEALGRTTADLNRSAQPSQAPSIRTELGTSRAYYVSGPQPQSQELPSQPAYDNTMRVRPRALPSQKGANPDTALGLEILGYLGIMGLGHMYGGHTGRGWILMVAWWIVLANLVFPNIANLTTFTLLTTIFIYGLGPVASGIWISSELRQARSRS
jgi:hypothetical protein